MKFFVGVTDGGWFNFLSTRNPNVIAGGGFFLRHELMPMSMAWEVFRENNGVADYASFASKIIDYQSKKAADVSPDNPGVVTRMDPDPVIGCIILAGPFFWPKDQWLPQPADWKSQIVRGKGYTTDEPIGAGVWEIVQRQFLMEVPSSSSQLIQASATIAEGPAFGAEYLTRARLGQDMFRVAVIKAYRYRCAMTSERTLPVLQASHIKPYVLSQSHRVSNGLLLRADLHILFDRGLITVTPDYTIRVSAAIRERYQGGEHYYLLHGRRLVVPPALDDRPDRDLLQWHNGKIYEG
jgi:putative restriction endonuclease